MKRIVIILTSSLYFNIALTYFQTFGIFISNIGVLLYIKFKNSQNNTHSTHADDGSTKRKRSILLITLIISVYGSGCYEVFQRGYNSSIEIKNDFNQRASKYSYETEELQSGDVFEKTELYRNKRQVCLKKIKNEIRDGFKNILKKISKKITSTVVYGIPLHNNYGDVIIWFVSKSIY